MRILLPIESRETLRCQRRCPLSVMAALSHPRMLISTLRWLSTWRMTHESVPYWQIGRQATRRRCCGEVEARLLMGTAWRMETRWAPGWTLCCSMTLGGEGLGR